VRPSCVFARRADGLRRDGAAPRSSRPRPLASASSSKTPFFPQSDYQCARPRSRPRGAPGVETTADDLVAAVYRPARHGSLQTELIAATRARGRLPYVLPADVESMFAEVAGGRPVVAAETWCGSVAGLALRGADRLHVAANRVAAVGHRAASRDVGEEISGADRVPMALLPLKPTTPAKPEYERYLEGAADSRRLAAPRTLKPPIARPPAA
jgi:hypothetical protein